MLWELRCATTVQGLHSAHYQGFFVHQLIQDDVSAEHVEWMVWRYQWDGADFIRGNHPVQSFRAPFVESNLA